MNNFLVIMNKKNIHSNVSPDFIPSILHDEAFNAKIEILDKRIQFLRVNSTASLPIKIINQSKYPWPSYGKDSKNQVNISYHWFDQNQKPVESEELRTFLPYDIQPNEEIDIDVRVRSPELSGDYFLEFNLVQEFVCWFKQKKSETIFIPIKVFGNNILYPIWPNEKSHYFNNFDLVGNTEKINLTTDDSSFLDISGWMGSRTKGSPVDNISLFLNSSFLGAATLDDKKIKFDNLPSEFQNCGWNGRFTHSLLKPGYNLLEVFAESGNIIEPVPQANKYFFVNY